MLPPATAATLVARCSVASQVQTLPSVWHAIDRARVLPMLAAGLAGVPAGAWLLGWLDPALFRLSGRRCAAGGKDERRGVFQAFNLSILAAATLWHAATGLVTREVLWLFLLALPGTFLGARLGFAVYRRLSDRRFRDVVLALLAFSGLTLAWGGL